MIPGHNAAEMRTHGGTFVKQSLSVAVRRNFCQTVPEHGPLPIGDLLFALHIAAGDPVGILGDHV